MWHSQWHVWNVCRKKIDVHEEFSENYKTLCNDSWYRINDEVGALSDELEEHG